MVHGLHRRSSNRRRKKASVKAGAEKAPSVKKAAKSYLDSQLSVLRKHGTVGLSGKEYRSLLRKVEAVTSA
jgi:hypothetical protein